MVIQQIGKNKAEKDEGIRGRIFLRMKNEQKGCFPCFSFLFFLFLCFARYLFALILFEAWCLFFFTLNDDTTWRSNLHLFIHFSSIFYSYFLLLLHLLFPLLLLIRLLNLYSAYDQFSLLFLSFFFWLGRLEGRGVWFCYRCYFVEE